ncbi:DUF3306 domain-containing protein [Hydrogenophaga sp.]|uniref:DUF3306 domain-containing protein n=1 Tax=Hydrogenophaga sp. TaxID=1904254 RepID=UPI0025BEDACF|nr:DUF3306 domain-containing protein [Hydrogenophaga sp.]
MVIEDDDNFFSRWSRRKVQVRSGDPLPAEPAPPVPRVAPPVAPSGVQAAVPVESPAEAEQPAPPPPTLEDVAELTPQSDFKRFVGRSVSPEVRNAAVRKLFTDPHYNVMDGLDIYIDDYSQPSPLSAAMMAKMVGAQFLKLVDDPNEVKVAPAIASPASDAAQVAATPETRELSPTAESTEPPADTVAAASESPQTPPNDHVDLQLQPDHAPEREGAGRSTG